LTPIREGTCINANNGEQAGHPDRACFP
jgi:hypothetical protein